MVAKRGRDLPSGSAPETGQNAALLSRIRELVGVRPSYGYRRVTALLNRELSGRVNPKRINRIMKRNKLLLELHKVTLVSCGSSSR